MNAATSSRLPATLALLLSACWTPAVAAPRIVAVAGESAPGATDSFESFFAPVLNDNGQTAFVGFLLDESAGVWSEGDGALRGVATSDDVAPAGGGALFGDFGAGPSPIIDLQLSNAGDVVFGASLDDFSTQGLWTDRDRDTTPLTNIVLDGQPPPGAIPGRVFQNGFFFRAIGSTTGAAAFQGSAAGAPPPNNFPSQGVYAEAPGGTLVEIAEQGDLAPGSFRPVSGGEANFTAFGSPSINNAGTVAFLATTNASTGTTSIGAGGVWTAGSGSVLPVALAGQTAPGTATTFSQFFGSTTRNGNPVINESGDVVFTSTLVGLIEGSLRVGIWVSRAGGLELVTHESLAAPGTAASFESIEIDVSIDAAGRAAFLATLDDGTMGLWRESAGGALELQLLEGQTPEGFSSPLIGIIDYAMNGSGQLGVLAEFDDGTTALLDIDTSGAVTKIVGTGDPLVVDGNNVEVEGIFWAGAFGSPTAGGTGYNESGQFAAQLDVFDFEDTFSVIAVYDSPTAGAPPGDFSGDGRVDNDDLNLLLANWGAATPPPPAGWIGDPPTAPSIDNDELNALLANWGFGVAVTIPEPASGLMLLGIAGFTHRTARWGKSTRAVD